MLTAFGKLVRKLRIDNGKLLFDMAQYLGVSPAYVSAVETGKRSVPNEWVEKLSPWFGLTVEQSNTLRDAALQSRKEVRINVENSSNEGRDLAVCFAKQFDSLTPEDREKLMNILRKGR